MELTDVQLKKTLVRKSQDARYQSAAKRAKEKVKPSVLTVRMKLELYAKLSRHANKLGLSLNSLAIAVFEETIAQLERQEAETPNEEQTCPAVQKERSGNTGPSVT